MEMAMQCQQMSQLATDAKIAGWQIITSQGTLRRYQKAIPSSNLYHVALIDILECKEGKLD